MIIRPQVSHSTRLPFLIFDRTAEDLGTSVLYRLPRDPEVQRCEERGTTVVSGAPESAMADR